MIKVIKKFEIKVLTKAILAKVVFFENRCKDRKLAIRNI